MKAKINKVLDTLTETQLKRVYKFLGWGICKNCGKEFEFAKGYYNYPSGAHCKDCRL